MRHSVKATFFLATALFWATLTPMVEAYEVEVGENIMEIDVGECVNYDFSKISIRQDGGSVALSANLEPHGSVIKAGSGRIGIELLDEYGSVRSVKTARYVPRISPRKGGRRVSHFSVVFNGDIAEIATIRFFCASFSD